MTYAPPGWKHYYNPFPQPGDDSPIHHDMIELWRPEWPESRTVNRDNLHPAMNVDGLFWRPASKAR